MRAVFFVETCDTFPSEITQLALKLNWVTLTDHERPCLTTVGARVADSAREYCNWLDDRKTLPVGVTVDLIAGKRVLDVGCGFGRHLFSLQDAGAVATGVELDEIYIQLSQVLSEKAQVNSVRIVRAAGEHLPFPAQSFDVILCTRSIAYMKMAEALFEMSRVLSPNGCLMLVTGTTLDIALNFINRHRWQRGTKFMMRNSINFANSCWFQLFRQRMFGDRIKRSTSAPVYVTVRFLTRLLEQAGLRLVEVHREVELFVVAKA